MGKGDKIVARIHALGLSIYHQPQDYPHLLIEHGDLESVLNKALRGLNLNYPQRTRSKHAKAAICQALGYSVPENFTNTQPRLLGQNLDCYVQKANNLQVWNEDIVASRRYAIVRIDDAGIVTRVKVITGESLALFDKTGTLTHKLQAKAKKAPLLSRLVTLTDTSNVMTQIIGPKNSDWPGFLPIEDVFKRLKESL